MRKKKILFPIILLVMLFLGVGISQAGPPDPIELPDVLKIRPDLPVGSISVRSPLPDHPPGKPVQQGKGPTELPDVLKNRPDLPVRSIPVVSPLPSHPPGEGGSGDCDKDIDLTSTIKGVTSIAALDTGLCTNADIDTYVRDDGRTYVVLAGGDDAAWTHIDVTDPANPVIVGQFAWTRSGSNTYTPDVKTFQQGANDYIALALERRTVSAPGGVVIVNVRDPANPVIESQTTGDDWVDVHNVFVEDVNGEGAFIYVTADNPADLRVLDISGAHGGSVSAPAEIGRYFRTVRGFGSSGFYDDIYVHDVTVEGGVVYASYWEAGLDIFDASLVKPGTIDESSITANIDPSDFASGNPFLTHHAYPSADGSLVALQDEIEINSGAEVVQLWTSGGSFVDGLAEGSDVPVIPAHNLEIRFDIDPDRLYVGWYKAGLEAWDFSGTGFSRDLLSDGRTSVQYHQVQTEADDADYSGAWGVRMENIGTDLYLFQSDRNFGLIVDKAGATPANTSPTADDKTVTTDEDTPVTVTLTATDPEECELTFSIVDPPANGTLNAINDNACTSGSPNSDSATVTYTPNADFNGSDSFTYKANDGISDSNIATVSITVNPVNDPPVANDVSDTTTKNTQDTWFPDVSDVDGDPLTCTADSTSLNGGTVTVASDCSSGTYDPLADFTGTDSFSYTVSDGALTDSATVTYEVTEPAAGVTVDSITPNSMQAGTTVDVTITGTGFAAGAEVTFENGAGPAPTASNVVVVDANTITASVTAKSGGPPRNRVWDVRVTNPDGSSGVLAGGFTVEP